MDASFPMTCIKGPLRIADGRGAHETTMAPWGAVLDQANLSRAASWPEGALAFCREKSILHIKARAAILRPFRLREILAIIAATTNHLAATASAWLPDLT